MHRPLEVLNYTGTWFIQSQGMIDFTNMVTNTTVEVALIYANRDGEPFPLTITPFTMAMELLVVVIYCITAYMANQQDVVPDHFWQSKRILQSLSILSVVLFTIQR